MRRVILVLECTYSKAVLRIGRALALYRSCSQLKCNKLNTYSWFRPFSWKPTMLNFTYDVGETLGFSLNCYCMNISYLKIKLFLILLMFILVLEVMKGSSKQFWLPSSTASLHYFVFISYLFLLRITEASSSIKWHTLWIMCDVSYKYIGMVHRYFAESRHSAINLPSYLFGHTISFKLLMTWQWRYSLYNSITVLIPFN